MNGTNKFLLLKMIATQGPISRISLSEKTGLSKMTVTALVNEYIEKGIVYECGLSQNQGSSGRRPILLDIVADSLLTLGINIDRDYVRAGIIDLRGNVVVSNSFPMGKISNAEDFMKAVYVLCDSILKTSGSPKVWGIGVSSIGPISVMDGVIYSPPAFYGIHDVPIVERLKERYDLPVYLAEDTKVSALAEMYFGNAQNYDYFFFVDIQPGVGGGMIIDRKLYSGAAGMAGSFGHSIVEPDGIPCECGQRGCLERYCSTRAVLHWAKDNGADPSLTWLSFLDKVESGDEICVQAVKRMCHYLAIGLTNIIAFFDPQCIFIGGDLWTIQDMVVNEVRKEVMEHLWANDVRPKIDILTSRFLNNADYIGTAALVMENNLRAQ
ncbi:ROK family transcriptional regulator [Zongyangia hominis]|uniref:ROK family transcriptional regulator n=1 Tax=Zongyangia hominis TaxID=2763677 RepID=A0A926ECP3_9FIRM|nr:ROK family transcriptional regulator [Zongyangia hominis]MBC8569706.1 ROK family transcriptional regulator [Zongyangia hominis]